MSIFSSLKGLFKKEIKMKSLTKGKTSDSKDALSKPILRPQHAQDAKGMMGAGGTVVRNLSQEAIGPEIDKKNGDTVAMEKSEQPSLQKPEKTNVETLVKEGQPDPDKRLPELSALELAEQVAWEGKKARIWQKGDLILNTYKVDDVKEGGMGYIYIAEHQGWKVKMAIKSPNDIMLSDRSLFSRVLREANAWVDLGLYPHIAYCYYVRQIEDVPHIFIEYVDGGTLREWITDAKCYDLKVGLDIAIQFCHGMEHAHNFGMIHRDIKPENILMTKDGLVKVTDFGIAGGVGFGISDLMSKKEGKESEVISKGEENLTTIGTRMGSYDYMSPEQYEDPHNVDARADIYSFGVCLYEIFCGKKPYDFAPGIAASVLARMDNKKPHEPKALREDIPPELAMLLKKCCQLDRHERYASFQDLRKELIKIYLCLFNEDPSYAEVKATKLKADGLNNRGVSSLDLGREEDARKCWQEALKEDPQHLEATFNYGYLRWQRAEILDDMFLTQIQELKKSKESSFEYWRCLAWIHFERGDIETVDKIQQSTYKVEDVAFKKALNEKDRPIGRCLRTLKGHISYVKSASFSPDGRYVISGSVDNIRLWDVESGREIRRFEGQIGYVLSICFSPDGHYVLSGDLDKTIKLWDVESGKEIKRFTGHTGDVFSVCFSPDGIYVLSGSKDKTIRLWDVRSEKEIKRFEGHIAQVNSVCFSPDGHYILSGGGSFYRGETLIYDTIRLWDLESGREIKRFEGHKAKINSVCFSSNGRYILSGSGFPGQRDCTIRLWDLESGKEIKRFEGHTGMVTSVCFSPDGYYILSGSGDKTIRVWDIESGRAIRRLEGHTNEVNSVCFSSDGRYALSAGSSNLRDCEISLWEIYYPRKDWEKIRPYPLLCKVKTTVTLSKEWNKVKAILQSARDYMEKDSFQEAYNLLREGQTIPMYERDRNLLGLVNICGAKGKGVRIRLKDAWNFRTFEEHIGRIWSVCFSPDNRYALSGGEDQTVRLWDLENGHEIRRFEGHSKGTILSVSFSSDGRYVISGSNDQSIRLWDLENGHEINRFEMNIGRINSISFSHNGRYALIGSGKPTIDYYSSDNKVRLWDIEMGREIRQFEGHIGHIVYSSKFSHDGRYVLLGIGWTMSLCDVECGREIKRFEVRTKVESVCFSPDSRYALSGGDDKTIRFWDMGSREEIRRFEGHTDSIKSVCFSPDGLFVLSGSADKTLRLWEVESGREIKQFLGHIDFITSVSFSPDGRYALSGSADKTIRLWEFDWEWGF